ncbi:MAG: phosphoenolpyruvate--protein phosphotransferase [Alphaproteobacteria bacterium]|nr:phosphoenolpyruvate--protein phosphotransferase [Alphaproteobacteria bacterium]
MVEETATWSGSRRLLRRLRDMMAGPGTAQARLDAVVRLIARDMVAEVCSVYVRRAGDVLELFATEGLKPEAVHRTRLRVGEGLVGEIALTARGLALADAQGHPSFAYRPETGEEIYSSLMGVPVLRGGRVQGVLVVQNRTQRNYQEEEIEALETVAMVLAELVAGGELVSSEETRLGSDATLSMRLEGLALVPGLARGSAVLHRPRVGVERLVSDDPDSERRRLAVAVSALQGQLDALLDRPDVAADGEHRDVLEAYRMFAHDRGWLKRIDEAILSGLTAEAAVQKAQDDNRARMAQATDLYLRERLFDLDDLTNRLLQHLVGRAGPEALALAPDTVLVARSMGPSELLNYDPARLRAVLLEEGSPTAHVTIVARSLGVPLVGRIAGLLERVESGDTLLVDADAGVVYLRPTDDVVANFEAALAARTSRQAAYQALRDRPAVTRDGRRVSLQLNAGLLADMGRLADVGADGVGLYRTEIPFMLRATYPSIETQTEFYRRILDAANGRRVVFRTLDIGGDKLLPYFHGTPEDNPAMGWRAVRIALDRPAMLRGQLRALIAAAEGRPLAVMFPMVAQVAEFIAARDILEMEIARARAAGRPLPQRLECGVMLEVPALALQLPALLPRVDFLSVGSNDLVQFLFASDRANPRLEGRYDVLAPAVLRLVAGLVADCAAARLPLAVCGEMAGDPVAAMALVALGVPTLSMAPAAIGPVKATILSLGAGALAAYLDTLLGLPTASLRGRLRAFARDHDVAI